MSPIAARNVASLYGCKPNLENWHIFEAFVIQFLGAGPITETTGIILVCFDGKYTWADKKRLKIWKFCLRTYYSAGLKQPQGPRVGQPCSME